MFTPTVSYIETRFLSFWTKLRVPFRLEQQYQIGPFFVDFAHVASRVVIELDGHAYHSTPEQIEHDQYRQRYIEAQGYRVIRFTGQEVYHMPIYCVRAVQRLIERAGF